MKSLETPRVYLPGTLIFERRKDGSKDEAETLIRPAAMDLFDQSDARQTDAWLAGAAKRAQAGLF